MQQQVLGAASDTAALLDRAFQHFQQGDLAAAEDILATMPGEASALHLMGVMRARQGRMREAADLLVRSVAAQPLQTQAQLNLGKVLGALGRRAEAVEALNAALKLEPDLADAAFALGKNLHADNRLDEAADAYRTFLRLRPRHVPGKLALGAVLIETGRPQEAEALFVRGLSETTDKQTAADLHQGLALAKRKQWQNRAALDHYEKAQTLDPARINLDFVRATLLEELHQFADAEAIYEKILKREPDSVETHYAYNELLYRLGAEEKFLTSYDRAPKTKELELAKASFLLSADRCEEAQLCYSDVLAHHPESLEAALGVGIALAKGERSAQAVMALEQAARRHPGIPSIYCSMSGALTQLRDPEKANAMAVKALEIDPHDQASLAMLGTSWRMMGDARDETLNGYDTFIQVFDLEPPAGFADMTTFNAELCAYLEGLHPRVREYLRQSLRGGTQTPDNLFGAGHFLVEKLRGRIAQAVDRYIAELEPDEGHPFLSRKRASFRFAGSWSSRLRDCGFHINHVHPGGWISSCYYVDVPSVVKDENGKQGWIKFGEPSHDVGLAEPVRRVILPVAGQLVLFPSYMWHGTVPFRDSHARTTIAFDAVPT